jgi:hypothetical protein
MRMLQDEDQRLSLALADLAARGWPVFDPHGDADAAAAALASAGVGDGLPLVMPTAERMAGMLAALPWARSVEVLGRVPPLEGSLTPAAIAYHALIAGCRPAEMPLLHAAALATLEPRFNLLGVQTTTGSATVALLVHGPAVAALGMNSGANCLGPGNRANACIGRALHLVLAHVGGAIPGATDMATMGQPGKYVFCLAEGAHPALPPLHERRAIGAQESAVTVLGVSGTLEVLPERGIDVPENFIRPLAAAVRAAALSGGSTRFGQATEHVVLMPPELLTHLQDAGCEWSAFHALLARACGDVLVPDAGSLVLVCAGGIGEKMTCLQPWGGGCLSVTRRIDTP